MPLFLTKGLRNAAAESRPTPFGGGVIDDSAARHARREAVDPDLAVDGDPQLLASAAMNLLLSRGQSGAPVRAAALSVSRVRTAPQSCKTTLMKELWTVMPPL